MTASVLGEEPQPTLKKIPLPAAAAGARPIPFNKSFVAPGSLQRLGQALTSLETAGAGPFTRRCEAWAERALNIPRALVTPSCTAALEMAALLLDIRPGDEVVVPAFTFVSTGNAFALRGATIRFADSEKDHPNMDARSAAALVGPRTRAIVVVHYAGQAADIDAFADLSRAAGVPWVEDAAQAIGSSAGGRALGTVAPLGALSFHETKNVSCGEGGMLLVNQASFVERAEIIREKGTDRSRFQRRLTSKYLWRDLGSSFLTSDITSALLFAQLGCLEQVSRRRRRIVARYRRHLAPLAREKGLGMSLPPGRGEDNGHIYFLVCRSEKERTGLIKHLEGLGIRALFHYMALNESPFAQRQATRDRAPSAERFARCLLRLPVFHRLTAREVDRVCAAIYTYYQGG